MACGLEPRFTYLIPGIVDTDTDRLSDPPSKGAVNETAGGTDRI